MINIFYGYDFAWIYYNFINVTDTRNYIQTELKQKTKHISRIVSNRIKLINLLVKATFCPLCTLLKFLFSEIFRLVYLHLQMRLVRVFVCDDLIFVCKIVH